MRHKTKKTKKADPRLQMIRGAFDRRALKRVCEMSETDFVDAYGMDTVEVDQPWPDDFFHFRDNGSSVLAVAHLDTVSSAKKRRCQFLDTAGGTVVYSRALDDRLGAYVILELLPHLGIKYDVLLTTGEEIGRSTALFFDAPKQYDWIIEFDRAGTDVVLYQYEDQPTRDLVRAAGARVGFGTFTDISCMEHLGVKGFNWGVGYEDAHSPRAHAYLNDTFAMVSRYLTFHEQNEGQRFEHEETRGDWWWMGGSAEDADVELELPSRPPKLLVVPNVVAAAAKATDVPASLVECDVCGDHFSVEQIRHYLSAWFSGGVRSCDVCLPWAKEEGLIYEWSQGFAADVR
jgi:hypothetical protein